MTKIKVSKKEIDLCKKEYLDNHKYIGTNKPVILSDLSAELIIKSRKSFDIYLKSVHKSHNMTEWETKILSPSGTPRFYSYRKCKNCNYEQFYSSAGRFIDTPLKTKCKH